MGNTDRKRYSAAKSIVSKNSLDEWPPIGNPLVCFIIPSGMVKKQLLQTKSQSFKTRLVQWGAQPTRPQRYITDNLRSANVPNV